MRENPELREGTKHGTLALPLGYYLCSVPNDFAVLPVHWHEEIEITRIRKGSCIYYIQSQKYILQEGDILVLLPYTLHGIEQMEGHDMQSDSIVFHLNMLGSTYPDSCSVHYFQPLLKENGREPVLVQGADKGYEVLSGILDRILSSNMDKRFGYELRLKSELFAFLGEVLTPELLKEKKEQPESAPEKVRQAISYIQQHYREDISVRELAEVCRFSEYHFMRVFRKSTNMTCVNYINTYRISAAVEELLHSDKTITQIATENGFNTISYFNRLFQKKYGMTPHEFRISSET